VARSKRLKAAKDVTISLRIDQEEEALLRKIQEQDGVPVSEQVRRGLQLWFRKKGVAKPKRKS
jgi:hypothetical protein